MFSHNVSFYLNLLKNVTYVSEIEGSYNVFLYLNDFYGWKGAWVSNDGGTFHSPEKYPFTFMGKDYEEFLGNYWGISKGSPTFQLYLNGSCVDPYALSEPFQKYKVRERIPQEIPKLVPKRSPSTQGAAIYWILGVISGVIAISLGIFFARRRSSGRSL